MTGPNSYSFIITFLLINVAGAIFIAFPLAYFARNGEVAPLILGIILEFVTSASLIVTSLTDPGYIPRQDQALTGQSMKSHNHSTTSVMHKSQEIVARNCVLKLKYCPT